MTIPDKVIEQAQAAADCCDEFGASLRAFADVIAAWAGDQERERIIRAIEETFAESQRCPETNWMLALWDRYSDGDPLPEVLAAAGKDGKP